MIAIMKIRNYRLIADRTATAGQPTEDQFRTVKSSGFDVVINLSMPTSDLALPDERNIVTELGMKYAHIPVHFEEPTSLDFRIFSFVLDCFNSKRVLVHCVANKRVSVFMFLYRIKRRRVSIQEARRDLLAIWEPNETWQRFIDQQLSCSI